MRHAVRHADHVQQHLRALGALFLRHARVEHRQLHVSQCVCPADEVEILKYKADLAVADGGQLAVVRILNDRSVQPVAALGGAVERADEVHERGLARAGRADDRHKFALVYIEVDAVQDLQLVFQSDVKAFVNAAHTDQLSAVAHPIIPAIISYCCDAAVSV